MSDIILFSLNARYSHPSLGARYLLANLKELRNHTFHHEKTIKCNINEEINILIAKSPKIIGIGVYIWNVHLIENIVSQIKAKAPQIKIILGGPELNGNLERVFIHKADYIITGDGDLAFYHLCKQILNKKIPLNKIISGGSVDLNTIQLPYGEYTTEDILRKNIYVEASRGCPYKCTFCLSANDKTLVPFEQNIFMQAIEKLIVKGVRKFKFVDRTFNLKLKDAEAILQFFLNLIKKDKMEFFLHFELVPERLSPSLLNLIRQFSPGSLQFEIGIQTFNEASAKLIQRPMNITKIIHNLNILKTTTQAYLHVDLIAGLPGENLQSFKKGFNTLIKTAPHEIQVGILKLLKGTPLEKHLEKDSSYSFSQNPPFEILKHPLWSEEELNLIKDFAQIFDRVFNRQFFRQFRNYLIVQNDPFETVCTLVQQTRHNHGTMVKLTEEQLFQLLKTTFDEHWSQPKRAQVKGRQERYFLQI